MIRKAAVALVAAACACASVAFAAPDTVTFMSRDGTTRLTGYVFLPEGPGPHAAVVMLHGRAGPYSSLKRGTYTAEALTMRHKMWGEFWAKQGYIALHVDSFGPRGYPDGFPKHSYGARPPEVSEQHVRPLDAYGALDYLRSRDDVRPDRIGVQGWSNGAMTVLAAVAASAPGRDAPDAPGFRAAIAQYPGCAVQSKQADYRPYLPLLVFAATDDDEVSPWTCQRFAQDVQSRGGTMEFVLYPGAHHAYDDPGKTKQSHAPNREALADTRERAAAFFLKHLR
ncbi:MAG: dienelactone hydrolase family protein [Rhodospirillaceae bacterium]